MTRKIAMVGRQAHLKASGQAAEDLEFWLQKSPQERVAATTFLVKQSLRPGQRMDKAISVRKSRNS